MRIHAQSGKGRIDMGISWGGQQHASRPSSSTLSRAKAMKRIEIEAYRAEASNHIEDGLWTQHLAASVVTCTIRSLCCPLSMLCYRSRKGFKYLHSVLLTEIEQQVLLISSLPWWVLQ